MQKKSVKIVLVFVSIILFIAFLSNNVFADDIFKFDRFDNKGNETVDATAQTVMGIGIQVTRTVATGVSIIMITYIAIKYMMAAPSERADMKKSAAIFIVGAVLVFAAGNILTIIGTAIGSNSQNDEEKVEVNGDKSGKAIIYNIGNNVYKI